MSAHRRLFVLGATCVCSTLTTTAEGQTRASAHLDLGGSRVVYDDFLPSFTAFLSADARLTTGGTTLSARGSALRFESGRGSVQGFVAASQFLPTHGAVRAELSATAGGSRYADLARFAHALGRLRLHRVARLRGGWLGLTLGSTAFGSDWRPVTQASVGVWAPIGPVSVDATAGLTAVGDTTYTDVEAFGRLPWGPVTLEAWLGARLWSTGAGRGVYGEASATVPLHDRLALVIGAGRYPTDPMRGTIAGRYLSAAMRLTGLRTRRPLPPAAADPTFAGRGTNGRGSGGTPQLAVTSGTADLRLVQIEWEGPQRVEIVGDFTDWRPVPLTPVSPRRWEARLRIRPGVHRVSVRADGAAWVVPVGATRVTDEFGGAVGMVTVP